MTLRIYDDRTEDKKQLDKQHNGDYSLTIHNDDSFVVNLTYDNETKPMISFEAREDKLVVFVHNRTRLEEFYVNFKSIPNRELGVYKFNTRILPYDNLRKHQREDLNEFISP